MRDFQLLEAACGPRTGRMSVSWLCRRGLRRALRPLMVRLSEIFNHLADRLDVDEARLDTVANRTELALDKIRHGESRADDAERRLDRLESAAEILMHRTSGTTEHLEGLTGELTELTAQLDGPERAIVGLSQRLEAFVALHWDHVALARRLATIEDLLANTTRDAALTQSDEPLLPFPGCDDRSRAQAG